MLLPRQRPSSRPPWCCLAVAKKVGTSHSASRKVWAPSLCKEFVGWNRRVSHGGKTATFCDDGEVEEVFTSATVRTRDTVFPSFGDAGAKSATEAELQEFGESVRVGPDEEGPNLVLHRPGEEMQDDRGREQPDPQELRRRAAVASADAAGARAAMMGGAGPASAGPRRRITVKRPARPAERREERQNGGGDDPDRGEPRTRRQRVARAVVLLRALVAMARYTGIDRCWGRNDVYDGGGICDACGTELQEQCVQDDVRLASCAAELARTAGAAGEGEEREACDVEAGPSLDHGDDVEQLMGHQAVTYVTKILDTDEGTLTESLKEYFSLREKAVQALVELCRSIESDVLVASRHATYPREWRRTDG